MSIYGYSSAKYNMLDWRLGYIAKLLVLRFLSPDLLSPFLGTVPYRGLLDNAENAGVIEKHLVCRSKGVKSNYSRWRSGGCLQ